MKCIKPNFAVLALVVPLTVVAGSVGTQDGLTKIRGQIIAYRPAERVSQVVSHVLNSESFLFKLRGSGPTAHPVFAKVVYEHFGYSDLGGDVLSKALMLQISARRDTSCDETYGAFVRTSPTFRQEGTNAELAEKIVFITPFQTTKLSPHQLLRCYKFQTGKFRIEPGNPDR